MRVAVIIAWRPKNFPAWNGRGDALGRQVPAPLATDKGASPYVGIHLASLLPRTWDIRLYHEMVRDVDLDLDVDAVLISTLDFSAPHARELARHFRSRGIQVVVGGIYATLNPGYFSGAADAVVVGEAEGVMPALIRDLERRKLAPLYQSEPQGLADLPPPRYDLVESDFMVPMSYEATRGCPFTCSFCVLSAIKTPHRVRPLAQVMRDLQEVPSHWSWRQRKYMIFWDSNIGADRPYFAELCDTIRPLRKIWGAETSIDTITKESARKMGQAGCRFLYIGLESLSDASLAQSNKRHNKIKEYKQKLAWLHENQIMVMSIFLLGLDGDTPAYFAELPELIHDIGVDVPVVSFAAPIEKTPFHQALRDSGRLLEGNILGGMDGAHLLYQPKELDADELELAMTSVMRKLYSPSFLARRILRRMTSGFWGGLSNATGNLFYASFQRSLATSFNRRIQARGPWPGTDFQQAPATLAWERPEPGEVAVT